jgi:hypothetical protein
VQSPWLEDNVVDWLVPMDAEEASSLMKDAGYTEAYHSMTLRNPITLQNRNMDTFYIFGNQAGGEFVFVTLRTKEVFTSR